MTGFSASAWEHVADRFADICAHPFVTGLGDGTLPDAAFAHYLADDAHYLADYARVLAAIAARLPDVEDVGAWAGFAVGAVTGERELHAGELDRRRIEVSTHEPTAACVRYTAMLARHARDSPVEVAVAAALPCFRVYAEVGTRLAVPSSARGPEPPPGGGSARGPSAAHPYAAWISTYDDPDFAAAVVRAEDTADRLAAASPHREAMLAAYADATDCEWHFWDASWAAATRHG